MYRYHNGLTDAHAASSPWWAWPMNLKPVWFYQEGLALGTSAALYDAGSLVIWWLGIPALAFVSLMAFKRRSLALTLIAVGFAAQWVPWARIDRAAFQYHYYTALPFVVLSLGYLMAELWHGASKRTWQAARLAAGLAIMGPALLWLLDRPLCWVVGVESVNPGLGRLSGGHPDDGHHGPDARAGRRGHRRRHAAGQAVPGARRSGWLAGHGSLALVHAAGG